ncbi:MAG: UDP-glucose 4-epimerase GalE [Pseudanabaena sp. ELA645]|jgi:UDP-glucose 4-epimerase
MSRKILVTGGAGYIGSHIVRQLGEFGYDVVVYDNCSTGTPQAVLCGELVVGDLSDINRLYQVFGKYRFDAVIHLAGRLIVPESVKYPLDYYSNNTCNTLNLLHCCNVIGVDKFIFSSTAAVYGECDRNPVTEDTPTLPINPYGRSKLMSELIIQDYAKASTLRYVILRYFNVGGADPVGRIGQNSRATHLIANACNAALKRQSELKIFGTDFPTTDGTGIRDYIHVEDLAAAHIDSLRYLEDGGNSEILNCGYGEGYSVRQVVERVKAISGVDFPVVNGERRAGDPACVTASIEKLKKVLSWQPKYNNLDAIISSALSWEKRKLK